MFTFRAYLWGYSNVRVVLHENVRRLQSVHLDQDGFHVDPRRSYGTDDEEATLPILLPFLQDVSVHATPDAAPRRVVLLQGIVPVEDDAEGTRTSPSSISAMEISSM
jgi:hypothetical protein